MLLSPDGRNRAAGNCLCPLGTPARRAAPRAPGPAGRAWGRRDRGTCRGARHGPAAPPGCCLGCAGVLEPCRIPAMHCPAGHRPVPIRVRREGTAVSKPGLTGSGCCCASRTKSPFRRDERCGWEPAVRAARPALACRALAGRQPCSRTGRR